MGRFGSVGNSLGCQCRRIAIITDVHANLVALDAALSAIADLECDEIVHTGDAIGIGPFPAETLDRLLTLPRIRFLMGNHDAWFATGLPSPRPDWMSAGEASHHYWVHAQLDRADPGFRATVANWPWILDDELHGVHVRYQHYALDIERSGFCSIAPEPEGMDLDRIFAPSAPNEAISVEPDLVFYGHHHPVSDLVGSSGTRYVNPGALGCSHEPLARFAILDVDSGGLWQITHHAGGYDRTALLRAFDERDVPERDLIRHAFFGT